MNLLHRALASGLLAAMLPIAACTGSSLKWTEDVLLPDGRTVTLTRYQEFKGAHEPFQPPTGSDYWLEFKSPDTGKKVRWESDRDLAPVALWLDNRIPRLLVTPNYGGTFRYECPDPPYLAFEYVYEHWVRVPLKELASRVITPNMTSFEVVKARSFIEAHHNQLTSDDVPPPIVSLFRGKVIDLSSLKEQTFGTRCDPPFNWMLRNPGDRK